MSVERDDSRGGRDLYVSFMKDDSVWTEPKNLGDIVNTAGEETAPFLLQTIKPCTSLRMALAVTVAPTST